MKTEPAQFGLIASALLLLAQYMRLHQGGGFSAGKAKVTPLKHCEKSKASLPDLMEHAFHHGLALKAMLEAAERRIISIESQLTDRPAHYRSRVEPFLADAKRIRDGVRRRLDELQRICRDPAAPEFLEVESLLEEKLAITDFGRELLKSRAGASWTRSLEAWQEILEALMRRAEFRCRHLGDWAVNLSHLSHPLPSPAAYRELSAVGN